SYSNSSRNYIKNNYQYINQPSIRSQITTALTRESKNRIKDEYKTIDERIGYSKSLGIKG
ncbi:hypothetical protein ACFLW3_01835, partial [Chloroflexota bacterium]